MKSMPDQKCGYLQKNPPETLQKSWQIDFSTKLLMLFLLFMMGKHLELQYLLQKLYF